MPSTEQTANDIAAAAKALIAAQKEMPAVEQDGTNPHFRSKFTTLDHLIAKTKPVLAKHGLAIMQFPTQVEGQPALRTVLVHESGMSNEDVMLLLPTKNDPQGQGAALTYAKRYAWGSVLGISTDQDDDGNQASNVGKEPQAASLSRPDAPSVSATGITPEQSSFPIPAKKLTKPQQAFVHVLLEKVAPVYNKTKDEMEVTLVSSVNKPVREWTKDELDRLVNLAKNAGVYEEEAS